MSHLHSVTQSHIATLTYGIAISCRLATKCDKQMFLQVLERLEAESAQFF